MLLHPGRDDFDRDQDSLPERVEDDERAVPYGHILSIESVSLPVRQPCFMAVVQLALPVTFGAPR